LDIFFGFVDYPIALGGQAAWSVQKPGRQGDIAVFGTPFAKRNGGRPNRRAMSADGLTN